MEANSAEGDKKWRRWLWQQRGQPQGAKAVAARAACGYWAGEQGTGKHGWWVQEVKAAEDAAMGPCRADLSLLYYEHKATSAWRAHNEIQAPLNSMAKVPSASAASVIYSSVQSQLLWAVLVRSSAAMQICWVAAGSWLSNNSHRFSLLYPSLLMAVYGSPIRHCHPCYGRLPNCN